MAATRRSRSKKGETLELVLVYGQKKLPLLVSLDGSDRPGETLTVGHLSDAVTEVSQVEAERQKLIHRGKTLFKNDPESLQASFEKDLASLGIKSGDRIMLLGRKAVDKQEVTTHSEKKSPLNDTKSEAVQDRLGELQSRLDLISGKLEQQVTPAHDSQDLPGLKFQRRVLMGLHEETMRLLETVDATEAEANSRPDFRMQRKALVNALQSKLDQCESRLSDVSSQIKCLERQDQSRDS